MKTSEHIYGFLIVPAQALMWIAAMWLRFIGKICKVRVWPPIDEPNVGKSDE